MAKKTRLRALLAKDEATYGTDSTASGSNDAILATELSIVPLQADEVTRDLVRSYLGNYDTILANTRVEVTITVELAGSGQKGVAPQYSPLFKSCGLDETVSSGTSVSYTPISSGFDSCTIVYNADGVKHLVTGCRGTFSISCEVGSLPSITFVMTGKYNNVVDGTMPACTFQKQATPLLFKQGNTSSFQFHSFAGKLNSWNFDLNNEIIYRELVGGSEEILINDRTPSGSVQIENPVVADKDFFTAATTNLTGNNTFLHGTTDGNKVKITMPAANISIPAYESVDNIDMLSLPYTAKPVSGNDELEILYT